MEQINTSRKKEKSIYIPNFNKVNKKELSNIFFYRGFKLFLLLPFVFYLPLTERDDVCVWKLYIEIVEFVYLRRHCIVQYVMYKNNKIP